MVIPVAFLVAFYVDGISFFNLKSMSTVGVGTYFKAFLIAVSLGLLCQKLQRNLLTSHLGTIYRKLAKYYGFNLRDIARRK